MCNQYFGEYWEIEDVSILSGMETAQDFYKWKSEQL